MQEGELKAQRVGGSGECTGGHCGAGRGTLGTDGVTQGGEKKKVDGRAKPREIPQRESAVEEREKKAKVNTWEKWGT